MTRNETVKVLAILKAAYPNSYSRMTAQEAGAVAGIWTNQFFGTPVELVMIAVNKLIATSTFPPAIAEVKAKIRTLAIEADEALLTHPDLPADKKKALCDIKDAAYRSNSEKEPSIMALIYREEAKRIEAHDQ